MGKGVRVVLPSCLVTLVRKHFPEESAHDYTGFREVLEVMDLLEEDF